MKVQRTVTLKTPSWGDGIRLTLEDAPEGHVSANPDHNVKVEYAGLHFVPPTVSLADLREAVSLLEAQRG